MGNIPVDDNDFADTKLVVLFDKQGQLVGVYDTGGNRALPVNDQPAKEAAFGFTCEKKGSPGNCFWINGTLYCI